MNAIVSAVTMEPAIASWTRRRRPSRMDISLPETLAATPISPSRVITVAGDIAVGMINGSIIAETVFGLHGVGKVLIDV